MISFIVIGRNEGWRLDKCFGGIYKFVETEGIDDYEVIYVDSKSTDQSVELSKSVGNTKTIVITGECNAAVARNIGARVAGGSILFFIDGDMELIPGFWSSIVCCGKMMYPFVSGIEKDILHDNEWNYVNERVRRKFTVGKDKFEVTTGGLFVIESSLWNKIGGMDNRFKRSQDLDLGFRLTRAGYRLCRKPQVWVNHYTRDYQIREDYGSFFKYSSILLRKHFFNLSAQKFLFGPNYTLWALVISCTLIFLFKSWLPILIYITSICFRTYRSVRPSKLLVTTILMVFRFIWHDFVFIFNFFTFWPKDIRLEYEFK